MKQGVCNVCRKRKQLYDNGACGGCQAQKMGENFAEWLMAFILRKVKELLKRGQ